MQIKSAVFQQLNRFVLSGKSSNLPCNENSAKSRNPNTESRGEFQQEKSVW